MWLSKKAFNDLMEKYHSRYDHNVQLIKKVDELEEKIKGHCELNREYQAALQRKPQNIVRHVVIIPPANRIETMQYLQQLSQLCEGQWYIHFFEELKREGIEQFSAGKETADYWRGWLALIGRIFGEARNCKPKLDLMAMGDQSGKEGIHAEV